MNRRSFFGAVLAVCLVSTSVPAVEHVAPHQPPGTHPQPAGVPSDPDPHPQRSFEVDMEPQNPGHSNPLDEQDRSKLWTIVLVPQPGLGFETSILLRELVVLHSIDDPHRGQRALISKRMR